MNMDEARKMWSGMMNDEELTEWLKLRNKIRPEEHDPKIPKGATIELDSVTGRHIPDKYND